MPAARLTLNRDAASAAPVPPAHTSACALPAATALAACTIEACGCARTAPAGSGLLAIETGASTTSTRGQGAPSSSAGPNRIECTPCSAARAAPAATSPAPKSAPLQSTATTVAGASCAPAGDEGGASGTTPVLLVVVLVIAGAGARRHDLAARVGAAHRAHPVRSPRAVAARARVQCGDADLVLGAALGGPAVGRLFLGDGHRGGKATSRERSYFSLSSRSLAQRGSAPRSWWCPAGASLRSAAHTGHRPAQSSRQSTLSGAVSTKASRAQAARSRVSSFTYGLSSSSP